MEWAEWHRVYEPTCPNCRIIKGQRNPPEDPPCETCKVVLLAANEEAAMVYNLTQGQVITAGEAHEIIDVNHVAVWQAIDRFKVKDPVKCFGKVNRLFHYFLSERRKARDK